MYRKLKWGNTMVMVVVKNLEILEVKQPIHLQIILKRIQ